MADNATGPIFVDNDLHVGMHILTEDTNYMVTRGDYLSLFPFPLDRPRVSHHWEVTFENGYGASVITGPGAYCSTDQPYELAVVHDGNVCFRSPITDDIMGHLDLQELEHTLDTLAILPRKDDCTHVHTF